MQGGKALWWILLAAAIAAGAVYYFYFLPGREPPAESVTPLPAAPMAAPATPTPEPEPQRDTLPPPAPAADEQAEEPEPLPALTDSDGQALESAEALVGETAVRNYLVSDAVIARTVAAVDALTRNEIPVNILPVHGPGGSFEVTEDGVSEDVNPETGLPETRYVLDPVNFQRYTSQVETFEAIDTAALVAQYRKYYPLLQQSYRELGYAEGDFNGRLMEVIDHLMATPEPERPVRLLKPEAFYVFADPELEGLSAGQKLLIRMGPSNEARVKAKLGEIRYALQTQRE